MCEMTWTEHTAHVIPVCTGAVSDCLRAGQQANERPNKAAGEQGQGQVRPSVFPWKHVLFRSFCSEVELRELEAENKEVKGSISQLQLERTELVAKVSTDYC